MPKPFPPEFRRDVVAVARKGEAPLSQIAKDFGISESCLHRWLKIADVDEGIRPGVTSTESAQLRRCVVGPTDVLNPCRVRGQIAWASSVNAAATRVVGGASRLSS
jgi:transposase-like protein